MQQDDTNNGDRAAVNGKTPSQVPSSLTPPKGDDYAKKNLIQIPAINMPKGGGALKSIDEKFQVNAANGTSSFSIPIPLSKSRGDFAPSLSLSYNSGSGDSLFGLGWNISLPAIKRRTDKLLPRYQDSDESDIFQLEGSEDLVLKLLEDANGQWQPDLINTGKYLVKRYRPRMEGAFTLIEQVNSTGGVYWKTTAKDNTVTFYGLSTAGRIADPADPTHVYEWLPEIAYDDKGNCHQFFYTPEDLVNVPVLLHEGNRLNGNQGFANTYLKKVVYGNIAPYSPAPSGGSLDPYSPVVPDGTGYLFSLVLDYGDHDLNAPAPVPSSTWGCRLDPFSNCKPGFDMRTYRLCRRFLMFHNFPELDVNPVLVKSLDLIYKYYDFQPVADPYTITFAEADFITSVIETGWVGTEGTGYQHNSFPPFTFTYQLPVWDATVQTISPENRINVPEGLTSAYQFTDLYNEGIAGIFSELSEGWYYNSNLGDGIFTPASLVAPKPSFTGLRGGSLQLQSLTGDGRKFIVSTSPPNVGYFELTDEQEWLPFMAFEQYPSIDIKDPNIKFIDLNGDGMPDIVLSEEQVFTWYPASGIIGYDSPELAPKPFDEEKGPAIVFADPVQSIFMADMNGDGLTDIVRIRNGEISYWPNMGYGKFGAKINMTNAPLFDTIDQFNPEYIHLSDINGTGATDVLYLGQNRLRAWLNLSGNAWGQPFEAPSFPDMASPNQLSVTDLLGNGTACIVWSSPLANNADSPLKYIDLMGGNKPYLVNGYNNGMGKQVNISYKSSTYFYLQDKLAGTPWITKLCFPVQCVESTSVHDSVSGTSYSCGYTYHHGYYDHPEKEYRGFGRVEQTDTDVFDTNALADQAPILTKTWFHTGAYFGLDTILNQFTEEYFKNPSFTEYNLPEPVLPEDLTADEAREAVRACKGMVLRQEIYALDSSLNPVLANYPYSVAEHNNNITQLQPQGQNLYAVFLSTESEMITYNYERNPADPRISHTLNTAFDAYGNIIDTYAVAYARQPVNPAKPGGLTLPGNQPLPTAVMLEQQNTYIAHTHNAYTGQIVTADTYRLPVSCESVAYKFTGLTPSGAYFSINDFTHPSGTPTLTKLKHQRTLFLQDDLTTPLPLYTMDTLGIVYQNYHLAFNASVVALSGKATPALLQAANYIESDIYKAAHYFPATDASGEWWTPSGNQLYLQAGTPLPFLLPYQFLDAYGYPTIVTYDSHLLSMSSVTDALDNTTTVSVFDYRTLSPQTVIDPNGNATDFKYDSLSLLVAIAMRGKGEGDVFDSGFTADLTNTQVNAFFSDPFTNGPALLQGATTRYIYNFVAGGPFSTGSVTRQIHVNQVPDPRVDTASAPYQYGFEYTDGLGRIAMKKAQADVYTGSLVTSTDCDGGNPPSHRWIGNGKTVYNNKGKPVMQYEPYFTDTPAYEEAPANGVSAVLHYDPAGRVIRTDFPDGSFSKTEFDAWVQIIYDQNDTVLDSGWYLVNSTSADPKAVDAAAKAAVHYNTPGAAHLDCLGRNFYSVSYNIISGNPEFYAVQTILDLENNPLSVIDAMGNTVMQWDYDLLNRHIHQQGMDAGDRWMLHDCMDKAFYKWDINGANNFIYQYGYDKLHRPLNNYVQVNGAMYLFSYNVYGEGITINGNADTVNNLRGKLYRQFDDAGLVTHYLYDFKGNLVQSSRMFTIAYKAASAILPVVNWSGSGADMGLLEKQEYITLAQYDALNRPILQVRPFIPVTPGIILSPPYNQATVNGSDVIVPGYGESGGLSTMNVYQGGGTTPTAYTTRICRNEKGQCQCIQYGNNTVTKYYYDTDTFRLIRLVTTASKGVTILQDLNYYYDPVGNITWQLDNAQPPVFYSGQKVLSDGNYSYDPLYRLISATGREQIGQNIVDESPANANYRNYPFDAGVIPAPGDTSAMRGYSELYSYDPVGNMIKFQHVATGGSYTRSFAYNNNDADRAAFGVPPAAVKNNQLLATTIGGKPPEKYGYDEHGNMLNLPQLPGIAWNYKDQFVAATQQAMGSGATGQTTFYNYDGSGARVRKVTEGAAASGQTPKKIAERLYIASFEIYRAFDLSGNVVLERESLHVTDDKTRIALTDKKTVDIAGADNTLLNTYYPRYQYGNHLGSTMYELDSGANIISYEEYHPFGTTSYQAADSAIDVPARRYRYTGKERDEESGLYYHGARYYAPWLARWTSSDPAGMTGSTNIYCYCSGNPIMLQDVDGMDDSPPCHTSCHHSDDSKLSSDLMKFPPISQEELLRMSKDFRDADKKDAVKKEAELTETLTVIADADKKSGTGTVCQTGCHGLRGLKNVHGDPKQMNEDAMLATKLMLAPLYVLGAPEAIAARGVVGGLLTLAGPPILGAVAEHGARAAGADKDTAAWIGFGTTLLAGWGLNKGLPLEGGGAGEPPPPPPTTTPLWKPQPGKEVFVGEWLNQNLQRQLDKTVDQFVADPTGMAKLVPPTIPYKAVPQYGGFVVEYGMKDNLSKTPILQNIVEGVPQSAQMVPGGAGDLQLTAPFQKWGLQQWDVTTPASALKKAAAGKPYTFLTYTVDWSKLKL